MISDQKLRRMNDAICFITEFQEKEGISPTIREIQTHLGVSSSSTAYETVKELKRNGWVTSKRNCPRTITITGRKDISGEHKR